jgi:hypothetical protein
MFRGQSSVPDTKGFAIRTAWRITHVKPVQDLLDKKREEDDIVYYTRMEDCLPLFVPCCTVLGSLDKKGGRRFHLSSIFCHSAILGGF